VEAIAFEISHLRTFQTSVTLTLDWVIWHITHQPLLTPQILFKSEKLFVDGQMDNETGFISLEKST